MVTRPVKDSEGRPYAFEIKNSIITLHAIQKVLSSVEEVSCIRKNKFFGLFNRSSIRVEFLCRGVAFVIVEPYGDSDVFWIGPKNKKERTEDIVKLEEAFRRYAPPFLIGIISHLFHLDFPET